MINEEEDDDEFLMNNTEFKPPDRSTSAPPSLTRLNSNSLFSFRANDLINDIRADEQYYEFYINHANQDKLPPPLEIQQSFYNAPEPEIDFTGASRNAFFQEYFKGPALSMPQSQFYQQPQPQKPYYQPTPQPTQQPQPQIQQPIPQQKQQPPYLQRQPSFGSAPIGYPPQPTSQSQLSFQQQQQQLLQQQQQQLLQQQQLQQQQQQALQQQQLAQQRQLLQQRQQHQAQQQQYLQQQQAQQQQQQYNNGGNSNNNSNNMHQNDLWGVQRGLSSLQMNDKPDDYIVKSSFDVAFSTVNQLIFDEPQRNANGNGLPRSASNSSLNQIFEPQLRNNNNSNNHNNNSNKPPQHPQNNSINGNSGIVRPIAKVANNILHSPIDMNQFNNSNSNNNNNNFNMNGHNNSNSNNNSMVHPSRTPTPPSQQQQQSNGSNSSPSQHCRYFTQGYCSKGSKCSFVHDSESSEKVDQQQSNDKQQQHNGNNVSPIINNNNNNTVNNNNNNNNNNNSVNNNNINSNSNSNNNNNNNNHNNHNNHNNNKQQNNNNNNNSNNQNNRQQVIATPATKKSNLPELLPSNIMQLTKVQPHSKQNGGRPSRGNPMMQQQQQQNLAQLSITSPPITDPITSDISKKIDLIANKTYSSIDQVVGSIYPLCRDQHGCRFLQKKLEESDLQLTEIIFKEVCDYMLELMTDPFGNYLCQKLLEHCNDQQRLTIIEKVGTDIVRISMNMHGTRAVQKMIEYLTTPEQIELIKRSLRDSVVPLIQDLNGNHVIQKCLNKLSPQDNQFIYDAVSSDGSCIAVATHRHGCCVLQRCIDHASESQKLQLIQEVIANSLVLVQDPYGNYVVQYVLDLPFQGLATEMAKRFVGHVPILATQKFSSNVVEKCLHVADAITRGYLIQEVIDYDNLLHLLQDPYANYVIQTSLTISEPHQHTKLVEAIRPHLPLLKNTPYGKRIQNKIIKEGRDTYNFN